MSIKISFKKTKQILTQTKNNKETSIDSIFNSMFSKNEQDEQKVMYDTKLGRTLVVNKNNNSNKETKVFDINNL